MIAIKPNHEDFKMMRELVRDFSMKVKYIGFPANQLLFCQQLTDVLFCYGIDSSIRLGWNARHTEHVATLFLAYWDPENPTSASALASTLIEVSAVENTLESRMELSRLVQSFLNALERGLYPDALYNH